MKTKYLFLAVIFAVAFSGLVSAQDLINAVKTGNINKVRELLPYPNIDERDEENYYTAYLWAADKGYPEIAELLLKNGAEPNALATNVPFKNLGGGLLIWAGDIMGAKSAAVLAQEKGHDDLIDFFLSKGNIDYDLRAAVMCNNPVVAEKALKLGADPDFMVNMVGRRITVSAAEIALKTGFDDILNILLEYDADITLAYANSFVYDDADKYEQVWEKLLEKGAELNPEYEDDNYDKMTLLRFAQDKAKYEGREKLDFLINHGVRSE